jgi:hypothetical protein
MPSKAWNLFFQKINCVRQPKGEIMKRKELTLALGFFTLLVLIGVGSSPVWKNEKWWKRWWVCEYEDGTLVYDRLRMERNWQHVFKYFNGDQPGRGNCEAFMIVEGTEHYICYDSAGAAEMKKRHGPIVSVRKQDPPPHRPPSKPAEYE